MSGVHTHNQLDSSFCLLLVLLKAEDFIDLQSSEDEEEHCIEELRGSESEQADMEEDQVTSNSTFFLRNIYKGMCSLLAISTSPLAHMQSYESKSAFERKTTAFRTSINHIYGFVVQKINVGL